VALPTLASFWRNRLGVTPTGALWAVVLGGSAALLVEVAGGFLGGELGRVIPVFLSGSVLLLVSRIRGSGPGTQL
jgi:hypothetical protein